MQFESFFTLQGLSTEEARQQIYLVDAQGLVYNARGRIEEYKKCMLPFPFSLRNFINPRNQTSLGTTTVDLP